VTGILATAASTAAPASLAVLGAGNLNDLDLPRLRSAFTEIHLVDVDGDSVTSALARLGLSGASTVAVHAPVDLTGVLPRLGAPGADAGHLLDELARQRLAVPFAPFGVTVSTGVLTQLLQSVHDSPLPRSQVERVVVALRDKHLLDLVCLTRAGGTVVLVSDVVSTTTAPELAGTPPARLEAEMAKLVAARNFFTGTNPYRLIGLLEDDPRFSNLVADVRLVDPWLWPVTTDRRHLTYAIVARRM
jgi:hypothetical protein